MFDQIKKLTTRQLEKFSYELGKQEEKSAIPLEKRIGAVYEILLEGLEAEDIEEVQELVKRRLFESYAKGNFSAIKAFFGYQPDTSEQAYMKWVRDIYCKGNDDCYKKWLIVYKKQKAKTEKEVKDRKERESKE